MFFLKNLRKCANIHMRICYNIYPKRHLMCSEVVKDTETMKLKRQEFGCHGRTMVYKYTWTNSTGFSLSAITYGAIVQSIQFPDKAGEAKDIVLGFDNVADYVAHNSPYLGAPIGRVANRICCANFEIDGVTYKLAQNFMGVHHLHGGRVGFDKVIWEDVVDGNKVIFSYLSKHCDEGYPGDLLTNITYEVTEDQSFNVDFLATTTMKTPVSMTQHAYFNLAGHDAGAAELYNHHICICSNKITETDSAGIPTGSFIEVAGTPYDLQEGKRLGDVDMTGNLFDNNYCVDVPAGEEGKLLLVSSIKHEPSGRAMDVFTDQPGIQFYTGNALPTCKPIVGKGGAQYVRHCGFCLETQKYADAVHHSHFPSVILVPGQVYRHKAVYKFRIIC